MLAQLSRVFYICIAINQKRESKKGKLMSIRDRTRINYLDGLQVHKAKFIAMVLARYILKVETNKMTWKAPDPKATNPVGILYLEKEYESNENSVLFHTIMDKLFERKEVKIVYVKTTSN